MAARTFSPDKAQDFLATLKITLSVAQDAASLAPFPGLSYGIGAILTIISAFEVSRSARYTIELDTIIYPICLQNVSSNQQELAQLSRHLKALVGILSPDNFGSGASDDLLARIDTMSRLVSVLIFVLNHALINSLQSPSIGRRSVSSTSLPPRTHTWRGMTNSDN